MASTSPGRRSRVILPVPAGPARPRGVKRGARDSRCGGGSPGALPSRAPVQPWQSRCPPEPCPGRHRALPPGAGTPKTRVGRRLPSPVLLLPAHVDGAVRFRVGRALLAEPLHPGGGRGRWARRGCPTRGPGGRRRRRSPPCSGQCCPCPGSAAPAPHGSSPARSASPTPGSPSLAPSRHVPTSRVMG